MEQQIFSDIEYSNRRKKTKREEFFDSMDEIIPWDHWVNIIRPYYPSGKRGRPPKTIESILRMYLMQKWFNFSDAGIKDAIYDSYAIRSFMYLYFLTDHVPDATTLLHFRHLIEENWIGETVFADVKARLEEADLMMYGGTIVDATIIAAPSSTENKECRRDPEMHQTKKGGQWYHGIKVHSGVDAGSGYVHTITGTAANVHDIRETSKLIREDDEVVYGDSGYSGAEKREEIRKDEHQSKVEFRTNRRPSSIKVPSSYKGINWDKQMEHRKLSTRCKAEYPFQIVKIQFGYAKVVYRGIVKNMNRFHILFTSANLVMCIRAG